MRIIAKKHLMDLARAHGDCVEQAEAWYKTASKAKWNTPNDVRQTYATASFVEDKVVFNVKGNHYRLIVYIRYDVGIIWIKDLLTHTDYDKGAWKG